MTSRMQVHRSLSGLQQNPLSSSVATIGVFDGVHCGHQSLLTRLGEWGRELQRETVVITFRQHPMVVLGHLPPAVLCSLEHRLLLLERCGVDHTLVLDFDAELASWSAERFVEEVLFTRLSCRHLLLGFDSAFGKGAQGTAEYLAAQDWELEVQSGAALEIDGERVSSSVVRAAVLKGELVRAERFLGRPVSLYGEVIHGDGRGKTIGFPTANMNLFHSAAPPHGVYLAAVELDGRSYGALVNIGRRPTFLDSTQPQEYSRFFNEQIDQVEMFIDDFSGDLYGRRLEATLHGKVRDERRFDSVEELTQQIHRDVETMRTWFERRSR
ncbi:MAG: riboflavin biosynthesis protein RibF [Planctomycetota bacterium]